MKNISVRVAKRAAAFIILASLVFFSAGCNLLMDNSADEPHPPSLSNFLVSSSFVTAGGSLSVAINYSDAGADIERFVIRDNNSGQRYEWTYSSDSESTTTTYFPGTQGTRVGNIESFAGAQAGPHTLVIWAEDSEGSISDVLENVVTLVL